jgi:hypothetical protein
MESPGEGDVVADGAELVEREVLGLVGAAAGHDVHKLGGRLARGSGVPIDQPMCTRAKKPS